MIKINLIESAKVKDEPLFDWRAVQFTVLFMTGSAVFVVCLMALVSFAYTFLSPVSCQ